MSAMNGRSQQEIIVALGLGANLGDRAAALRSAVDALPPDVRIIQTSPIYETAPLYVTDQPAFYNAAVIGATCLSPPDLLRAIKYIERNLGREPTFRYGPRIIDIDILFYGDLVASNADLALPHPLMTERAFVLRPLADIVPEWRHPITHETAAQMLEKLPQQPVRRIEWNHVASESQ